MAFNTKLRISDAKFYQNTGDTITLSGTTEFGKAEYIAVPTLVADTELVHKKYVDDALTNVTYDNVWMSGTTDGITLDYWYDKTQSAGRFSGGTITQGTGTTVNIAAGSGLVKDTDTNTGLNRYVQWDAVTNLATLEGYNYIYYDAATNQITATTTEANIKNNRNFNLGRVYNDGTNIIIRLCGQNLWNLNRRLHRVGDELFGVQRASGLVTTTSGSRYIQVSGGVLWAELLNRFETTAFDSNSTQFTEWYRVGTGWTGTQKNQITNTQWNNTASGLVSLTTNYYAVSWVYVVHDSSIHVVLHDAEFLTLAAAELATPLGVLPPLVVGYATLSARIITQKGEANITDIGSAFDQVFTTSTVQLHNDLGGIQGGATGEYNHVTDAEIQAIQVALSGATNGLSFSSRVVELGGTLSKDTTITAGNNFDLSLTNLDSFNLSFDNVSTITDLANNGGLRYAADYSTNYINRSLVDAGYVTGLTSALSSSKLDVSTFNTYTGITDGRLDDVEEVTDIAITGVTNGLTKVGSHDAKLGGTLTETTALVGSETLNINVNKLNLTGATSGVTVSGSGLFLPVTIPGSGGLLCIDGGNQVSQTSLSAFGGITGGTNGIGKVGQDLCLGAPLVVNTAITGDFDLCLGTNASCLNTLQVFTQENITIESDNNLVMSLSGGTITTSDLQGLRYTADYSTTFVDSSIVTKLYVDTVASGLDPKSAVLVATTADITLSGTQTIDGVAVVAGNRVLVKDQTSGEDNGIYVVAAGAWTRALDFDGNPTGEVTEGALIPVLSGNTQINSSWILITKDPIVVGTTVLVFTKFSQLLDVSAGDGIRIDTTGLTKEINVELASDSGLDFTGGDLTIDLANNSGLQLLSTGLTINSAIAGNALDWNAGVIDVNIADINSQLGGVLSGVTNGLTEITTGVVGLGGTLTQATSISGNDSNTLTYTDTAATNKRGILYAGDYSGSFVARSLVDKEYVDTEITDAITGATLTFENGLTQTGQVVSFGGTLTGNTTINGNSCSYDMSFDSFANFRVHNGGSFCVSNVDIIQLSATTISITNQVNQPTLSISPNGTVPLAISTVGYVTAAITAGVSGITATAITGATNGLTKVGQTVVLGGELTGNTTIFGNSGTYSLNLGQQEGSNLSCFSVDVANNINMSAASVAVFSAVGSNTTIAPRTTATGCVLLNVNANNAQLLNSPTGTIPLAIATVGYVTGYTQSAVSGITATAITGATNGLTKTGQDVKLGGTQLSETTIIAGNSQVFSLTGLTDLNLGATTVDITGAVTMSSTLNVTGATSLGSTIEVDGTVTLNSVAAGSNTDDVLTITSGGVIQKISASELGEDNNDYSKTIVTSATTLTTGSSYVILVNHTAPVTITLPATPFDGQAFKIKDASNNALVNNITIARSGNNIDRQALDAAINTDSGALELVYDATLGWFSLAFVN